MVAELKKETEEQEASKETEPVSEEKETEEKETEEVEQVITFKTQEELDAHVNEKAKPLAQGMKDKELKPVYDELRQIKADNVALKLQVEGRDDDSHLSRLEQAETKEWGSTAEVREIQDVRRDVVKQGREQKSKEQELKDTASKLDLIGRQQDAFEKALKLFLPENVEFISEIEDFASELSKAESQNEMDLLYERRETKMKAKAEAPSKPKRTRPDGSIPSAAGGKDWSKASASEKVQEGLRLSHGVKVQGRKGI